MNKEFLRMQKLAGLTEIKVTSPLSADKNATIKDNLKGWLRYQLTQFDTHPENPYWKGIDTVLKSKKVYDYILSQLQEIISEENPEDEDDYNSLEMILWDTIELEVMDYFFPIFIKNLKNNEINISRNTIDPKPFPHFILDPKSPEINKAHIYKSDKPGWDKYPQYKSLIKNKYVDIYDLNNPEEFRDQIILDTADPINELAEDIVEKAGFDKDIIYVNEDIGLYCNLLATIFLLQYGAETGVVSKDDPEYNKRLKDAIEYIGGEYKSKFKDGLYYYYLNYEEAFDLLDFKSDINENVYDAFERFCEKGDFDLYDI
jgi:hypothetical protein